MVNATKQNRLTQMAVLGYAQGGYAAEVDKLLAMYPRERDSHFRQSLLEYAIKGYSAGGYFSKVNQLVSDSNAYLAADGYLSGREPTVDYAASLIARTFLPKLQAFILEKTSGELLSTYDIQTANLNNKARFIKSQAEVIGSMLGRNRINGETLPRVTEATVLLDLIKAVAQTYLLTTEKRNIMFYETDATSGSQIREWIDSLSALEETNLTQRIYNYLANNDTNSPNAFKIKLLDAIINGSYGQNPHRLREVSNNYPQLLEEYKTKKNKSSS